MNILVRIHSTVITQGATLLLFLIAVAATLLLVPAEIEAHHRPDHKPTPTVTLTRTPTSTPTRAATSTSTPTGGNTYYVSKNGNNADGRSWTTAWNELSQINWSVLGPGATVLIDGGHTSMTYTSTLTIGKSGASTAPITIKLATEAGRNGKAIIFGGRATPLPYCGQSGYVYQTAGVRSNGVVFGGGGYSWLVIDGSKWRGITIHGHNLNGISLEPATSNVTIRNVEIYDNGKAVQNSNGLWNPDWRGVGVHGSNITFERAIIRDNGQDMFQSGGGIRDLAIKRSWLHNSRPHPTAATGFAFNHCTHSDSIQIYDGGLQSGVLIEDSVLGPGVMQGTIMGGNNAQVDNVTIRHSLFNNATSNGIMNYPNLATRNWTLDHVTSFMTPLNPSGGVHSAVYLDGSGHRVLDSILYGGNIHLSSSAATASGNCQFRLSGNSGTIGGLVVDPMFADNVATLSNNATLNQLAGLNFALQTNSPCFGKGSRITSVSQLLGS